MKRNYIKMDILGDPEPGSLGDVFSRPEGSPAPESITPPVNVDPPVTFVPNPAWNVLKENLGIDVPADLNAENELQHLAAVTKGVKAPTIHPALQDLNQRFSDPTFKYEDWLTEQTTRQNVLKQTGKEFMSTYLKLKYKDNPEEEITAAIDGLERAGTLNLEVMRAKDDYKNMLASEEQQRQALVTGQRTQQITDTNQKIESDLTKLFAGTQNITELYGVKTSKAEIDAFNKTFSELAKINDQGVSGLKSLLQSDEDLWKFAFLVINGDAKIKEALNTAKEGTKAEVLRKIRGTVTVPSNQKVPNQSSPNFSNWTLPAR